MRNWEAEHLIEDGKWNLQNVLTGDRLPWLWWFCIHEKQFKLKPTLIVLTYHPFDGNLSSDIFGTRSKLLSGCRSRTRGRWFSFCSKKLAKWKCSNHCWCSHAGGVFPLQRNIVLAFGFHRSQRLNMLSELFAVQKPAGVPTKWQKY